MGIRDIGLGLIFFAIGVVTLRIVCYIWCCISAAPFVETKPGTAGIMVGFAGLKPGMKVYDLGSGDARLLLLAAERGARAEGVEMDPFLALYCRLLLRRSPLRDRVRVRWGNLWWASVRDADVVFVYLMPWNMKRLKRMLESQLRPGTLVVSNEFPIEDWVPCKKDDAAKVYAYRVGAGAPK